MQLDRMLDRCHGLEQRAAAVYRTLAAAARRQPDMCALWTELAREEEQHAASVARARARLRQSADPRISIDGWDQALAEVEERLAVAERLGASATLAEQLAAALDLEMTEVDTFRRVALAAANASERDEQVPHAERLAEAAEALTDDPQVLLQVALLRARTRIQPS
jgi:rubrerythrin